MGKNVKKLRTFRLSDEHYSELQKQAECNGTTATDTLISCIETTQWENMTPMERSVYLRSKMGNHRGAQKELAKKLEKPESHVSKYLSLLRLDTSIQKDLLDGNFRGNIEVLHKIQTLPNPLQVEMYEQYKNSGMNERSVLKTIRDKQKKLKAFRTEI